MAVSVAADRTVLPVVVEVATVAASAASVEWVVMTLDGLLFLSLSLSLSLRVDTHTNTVRQNRQHNTLLESQSVSLSLRIVNHPPNTQPTN